MAIDPSIILGVKAPQFDNPLDIAKQAQSLQAMGYQNQIQQREMQNQQDLRGAYAQAMTTGPDGTPTIDRQKLMTGLQSNPMLAMGESQKLSAQDAAMNDQKLKVMNDHIQARKASLNQIPVGADVPQDQKQGAWTNMISELHQAGLDTSMYPAQHPGDAAVIKMNSTLQSAEEKLAQQNKQVDQTTERAKANASLAEAGLPTLGAIGGPQGAASGAKASASGAAGAGGFTPPPKMQFDAMKEYNSAVAGSRQQDDAKRALLNVQAGKNLEEIAKHAPGGDLNKLNTQQTKLAITELVKMAGGSVPTEGELNEMTPDNYAQKYSGYLQKLTNKSQPANAGEFIKQGIDYANGIRGLAAQNLRDRASEFADRQKPYLGDKQYNLIKRQIGDEYRRNAPASAQSSTQDYPIGTTAKSKDGTPVVYKGNGTWAPQ